MDRETLGPSRSYLYMNQCIKSIDEIIYVMKYDINVK